MKLDNDFIESILIVIIGVLISFIIIGAVFKLTYKKKSKEALDLELIERIKRIQAKLKI